MRDAQFPSVESMEKAGFNEYRIKFIEALRKVYCGDNKFRSIEAILTHLRFDKRTPAGRKFDKLLVRSILDTKRNSIKDNISGFKFKDLCESFHERFAGWLTKTDFRGDIEIEKHHYFYVYYYDSFSAETKQYDVKFGLIGFNCDSNENEWESGRIYYFNASNKITKKFELHRIRPEDTNTNVLFFSAKFCKQVNFFTIKINEKPIDARGILPITYSVTETQNKLPSAGKGILEKIANNNYEKRVTELINDEIGIDNRFMNALYHQKFVYEEFVYNSLANFKPMQTSILENLKGMWTGVYLRTDFSQKDSDLPRDKGGVCKFLLHLKGSGKCKMYWSQDINDDPPYEGFVEFPFNAKSLMKLSLEFMPDEKTYRMYIFLSAGSTPGDKPSYSGVMSGWIKNSNKIYTSPIYMKRIASVTDNESLESIKEFLEQVGPTRIPKTAVDAICTIGDDLRAVLKKAENEYMSMYNNCMPENL